mmetsp:Transcript_4281/g.9559  ORF Transcript_4281/g.9559 Transcript_4281/m.9559 type:complete len:215 (+) Transcript_4281:320-964(+)
MHPLPMQANHNLLEQSQLVVDGKVTLKTSCPTSQSDDDGRMGNETIASERYFTSFSTPHLPKELVPSLLTMILRLLQMICSTMITILTLTAPRKTTISSCFQRVDFTFGDTVQIALAPLKSLEVTIPRRKCSIVNECMWGHHPRMKLRLPKRQPEDGRRGVPGVSLHQARRNVDRQRRMGRMERRVPGKESRASRRGIWIAMALASMYLQCIKE